MRLPHALLFLLASASAASAFDLQGHRGARGLAPENTLPAFARALEIGVTTLELDVGVTRDNVVVLSHDPVLNPEIVRDDKGFWLKDHSIAVRSLSVAELKRFDVGRIDPATAYAKRFASQVPVDGTRMPTLAELFAFVASKGATPRFNIETKLDPGKPGETPDPATFARLLVEEIRRAGVSDRTTIQSFDWRTLTEAKKLAPEIVSVCLTIESDEENTIRPTPDGHSSRWLGGLDPANFGGSVPRLAQAAGCAIWSPYFKNLTSPLVAESKQLELKVVPWTVNTEEAMQAVIALGVDGLITDYPDIARDVLAAKGITRD